MKSIGSRIRYYREMRGLSRNKLVDGICDESTLFRIEKEDILPSAFIIEQLCLKLSIPVSMLLVKQKNTKQNEIVYLKKICRNHVYHKEYDSLSRDLNKLKTLVGEPNENNHIDSLFITWHKAIILHKRHNKSKLAKEIILHSLPPHIILETEIAMMNSLGLICLSLEETNEALTYFRKAFKAVLNVPSLNDQTLLIRVSYNYASRLFYLKEYQHVIFLTKQLITFLHTNHLSYMKGRILHLQGKTHEHIGNYNLAEQHMKYAIAVFSFEEKSEYAEKAKKDLLGIRSGAEDMRE